ncbi:MAG TPA: hypothetical protein DCR14_17005 [Acidimicrobiaceae bacterium]|nr:hypothetical protein [Acidimicrobiaceae bacterium]
MTHFEFLRTLVHSVREVGAAATLDAVRTERPRFDRGNYHHTRAVFYVWAVSRLVDAGLSDMGILWHPLVDDQSPLAWWHVGVLESAEAHETFIPSTEALPGEPQPTELAEVALAV